MSRSTHLGIALLALFSGFLGGLMSQHLVPSVFAQEDFVRYRAVEVESLRVAVDGKTYAVITASPEEGMPLGFDEDGRPLRSRDLQGQIRLFDSSGNLLWAGPPRVRGIPLK